MKQLTFDDFVGNEQAIKKVKLLIDEAIKDTHARMPDMAFLGASGHGKNLLANVIATECKRKLLVINSTIIRDPFQFRGLIMDLVMNNNVGSIVVIDECHALNKKIQDNLLTATEHPRELHTSHKEQTFTDKLPDNFSFVFATTHAGEIKPALLSRLESIELLPYSSSEQLEMAIKYMERRHKISGDKLDTACMVEVAKRARSGRQVARFCDTIVRYMKKHGLTKLDDKAVTECFEVLGVDKNGLTRVDRIMLGHLSKLNTHVGLDTLDAIMPISKKEIKDCVEPYLLKKNFIVRTSSGRMITTKGQMALKVESK
jgi:Holliday junction DNA helicase RuvB